MEQELVKYFTHVISENLSCDIEWTHVQLDPYVLVFLLPTWTSKVSSHTKRAFVSNPSKVFTMDDLYPELTGLTNEEKDYVIDIYRHELYTVHNIIEYYCDNMIDRNLDFQTLYLNTMLNTCSTHIATMEDHVNVNDRGILYYIPYCMLISNLANDDNVNPFTGEPYSEITYIAMRKKYAIEIKLIQ